MKQPIEETIFAGFLSYQIDDCFKIYESSIKEWDGVFFPYLWMADVAKAVSKRAICPKDRELLLRVLDRELASSRELVRNLGRESRYFGEHSLHICAIYVRSSSSQ